MATTTPNYLWSVPTSSDLVKNGATAIETLGDSVDASLWNSGFGQAGKNKIINGDFGIWQRGTSFADPANSDKTADRWQANHNGTGATRTISQQSFALGAAPVAGYEGTFFYRYAQTVAGSGGSYLNVLKTRIENVRTFAGQTVTLSFWAKADASRTITPGVGQVFGTAGGQSSSVFLDASAITLTTSWVRYTATLSLASISGKTLSAGDCLEVYFGGAVNTVQTIDFWGVQLEYGSTATPFQTASGGSPQAELAMCQRYYVRFNSGNGYGNVANAGYTTGATGVNTFTQFPVTMRTIPTSIDSANLSFLDANGATAAVSAPSSAASGTSFANIAWTTSGATAGRFAWLRDTAGAGTGYLGFSAEL